MSELNRVAVLDIGTGKIAAAIGEYSSYDDVSAQLIGYSVGESDGISGGRIVSIDAAAKAIERVIDALENDISCCHNVIAGISGDLVKSCCCRGTIKIGGEQITKEDVQTAFAADKKINEACSKFNDSIKNLHEAAVKIDKSFKDFGDRNEFCEDCGVKCIEIDIRREPVKRNLGKNLISRGAYEIKAELRGSKQISEDIVLFCGGAVGAEKELDELKTDLKKLIVSAKKIAFSPEGYRALSSLESNCLNSADLTESISACIRALGMLLKCPFSFEQKRRVQEVYAKAEKLREKILILSETAKDLIKRSYKISNISPKSEVVHSVVRYFMIDGKSTISPFGIKAESLECEYYVCIADSLFLKNIRSLIDKANINIYRDGITASAFASSLAVLEDEEKNFGTACADIGRGCIDLAVYYKNSIIYSASASLGGDDIIRAVSRSCRISKASAEEFLIDGCADPKYLDDIFAEKSISTDSISNSGEIDMAAFSQKDVAAIISECLDKFCSWIQEHLGNVRNCFGLDIANLVLTGGISKLKHIDSKFRDSLNMNVRLGPPCYPFAVDNKLKKSEFSSLIGLLIYGIKFLPEYQKESKDSNIFSKWF